MAPCPPGGPAISHRPSLALGGSPHGCPVCSYGTHQAEAARRKTPLAVAVEARGSWHVGLDQQSTSGEALRPRHNRLDDVIKGRDELLGCDLGMEGHGVEAIVPRGLLGNAQVGDSGKVRDAKFAKAVRSKCRTT